MELDVRRLRIVHTIAEVGSVTKAAARLGMSQPALTRQLQRIETALDGQLFMRVHEGVRPTAFGELVVSRARTVLVTVDSLTHELSRSVPASGGLTRVRIGSIPGPLLPGLVAGVRGLLPEAEVTSLTRQSPERLAELVFSGRLELAALGEVPGYEVEHRPGLEWHVVAEEPLCVMIPPDHPLASSVEVALADCASVPWVLPPPGDDNVREAFLRACEDAGFTPWIRHEAGARPARDLVACGEGVGLGQACAFDPSVVRIPFKGSPVRIRHLLSYETNGPMAHLRRELRTIADRTYARAASANPVYRRWLSDHAPLRESGEP